MRTIAGSTATQIDLFLAREDENDLRLEISPKTLSLLARMFREYAERSAAPAPGATEARDE